MIRIRMLPVQRHPRNWNQIKIPYSSKIKDVVFPYKIKSTPDDHRRYRNYSQQEIPKINLDWLLLYMAALGGSLFVSFIIICSICIYIRKMK
nr:ORF32 [Ostreid herpesvirus 1]